MAATTTTQVPAGVQAFYDRNLLERAVPSLVHDMFGQQRTIPKNNSLTIKFRRYNALAANVTPLTEGVTPAGKQLGVTDITATLAQLGDFVTLSDLVNMTIEDAIITEATDVLGDQAGDSVDQYIRNILNTGTNVFYANSVAARVNVAAKPSLVDMKKIIKSLKAQNAKPHTQMIQGSNKTNTFPIRPAFMAIAHTDAIDSFEDLVGWKGVEEYASQGTVDVNEAGALKNGVRFIQSTNAKIFTGAGAAGIDVYSTLIFGKDAYGVVSLKGQRNIETIVKPLGSGDDPLNQRASVGWKALVTAKIINDNHMMRYETA